MPELTDLVLGIVVVNYGSHQLLAENLGSLELDDIPIVVVVDNFHSAAERSLTEQYVRGRGWEFLGTESNLGFGAAVNIGVERALNLGCGAVVVLNPDAVASVAVLQELRRSAAVAPMTMVSPKICRPDGSAWFRGSQLRLRTGELVTSGGGAKAGETESWLTAACLLIPAPLWRRLGGFDPGYFLYWEDVDLSHRCLQAGGALQVRLDLTAVHAVGATQQGTGKSRRYYFYNCRNRLLFAAKHLDRRQLVTWLMSTPKQSWAIMLRGGGRRGLLARPSAAVAGVAGAVVGSTIAIAALCRLVLRGDRGSQPAVPLAPASTRTDTSIAVLQSFRELRSTSNPYLNQLLSALPADVRVDTFSWPRALLGRYDVFHVHWPELLIRGRDNKRTAVRRVLFILLLLRFRIGHTAVVRTVHNQTPHEPGHRVESWLLGALDRATNLRVQLNDAPERDSERLNRVILHGHYRDWYQPQHGSSSTGQLLFFGLIRPYKGVGHLLAAFAGMPDESLRLQIVGKPANAELEEQILSAQAADDRVRCQLEYVDDQTLAAQICAAELVVLPYAEMYNSGAAMLALSLNRPILVPDTEPNRALAAEVGGEWVAMYPGPLTTDRLRGGLDAIRASASGRGPAPDLSRRDWPVLGVEHRTAYLDARSRRRRRSRLRNGHVMK